MKYRLYTDRIYPTMTEQILCGRGVENVKKWLNADMSCISSWDKLEDIKEGVKLLEGVIKHDSKAVVVVDSDLDGYSSAAVLFNYLYSIYPEWTKNNLSYLLHDGKQHGLEDMVNNISNGTELILCPDSSSNDYNCHEQLVGKADILILDHHLADHKSTSINTITINNQLCDYPNKEFSGAGIVWQFCRAYDDIVGVKGKIDIDLAAWGNCGDMMSFKNIETKAFITEGFSNIQNHFFQEMINANEYTLNKYGGIGYKAIAFAAVPFVNATVRSGTMEEKEAVFRAMCDMWSDELVPNTKRGFKGTKIEAYKQAVYLTQSIKRRQTKLENESLEVIENKIKDEKLLDNAILVCCCDPGEVEPNIRGLAANKIASKYQRPCLVLTKSKTKNDEEYFYRGSGRNYSMSEVQDLKAIEESTGLMEYVQGHNNAHGCGIAEKNIKAFTEATNKAYENIPKEPVYWVDYIWKTNEVTSGNLLELAGMSSYWGQDIPASQIAIVDIDLQQCQLNLCGAKKNTLRMIFPNGIVGVKFGITEDDFNKLLAPNMYMTCIASPQRNEWEGKISGELIIDNYELESKWIF